MLMKRLLLYKGILEWPLLESLGTVLEDGSVTADKLSELSC